MMNLCGCIMDHQLTVSTSTDGGMETVTDSRRLPSAAAPAETEALQALPAVGTKRAAPLIYPLRGHPAAEKGIFGATRGHVAVAVLLPISLEPRERPLPGVVPSAL